jgi:hypothetical protein
MRSWSSGCVFSTSLALCALLLGRPAAAQSSNGEMFPDPPMVAAPTEQGPVSTGDASQPAPAVPDAPSPAAVEEGSGFPWATAIGGGAACGACALVSGGLSGLGIYFLVESLDRASRLNDPVGACCLSVIGIVGALVTNAAAVVLGGGMGPFSVAVGALIGSLVDGRPPWWGLLGSLPGAGVGLVGMGLAVAALTVLDKPLASLRTSPDAVDPRLVVFGAGVAMALLSPVLTLIGAVGATWLAAPAEPDEVVPPASSAASPGPSTVPSPPPQPAANAPVTSTPAPVAPPPASDPVEIPAPPSSSTASDFVDY